MDKQMCRLWRGIDPAAKAAFFSCFLVGYLAHLFAFANLIPNADGLSRMYDPQQMTVSGRWFLHYASALNDFTQMPAAIGLVTMVLLGLAAALTVDILKIRGRVAAGLWGAIMAAFPCLGYTFLYMFTASAYALAILLAAGSVWLARRGDRWSLAGPVLLALAMGIYQAYVTVAIGLALLAVLRETLEPSATFPKTLRLGLRFVLHLAVGAVLYYAVLMVFLKVKGLELLSYLGMDAASSGYPIGQLPRLILSAYWQTAAFFFKPGSANAFATGWMAVLDLAALAVGAACFFARVGSKRLKGEPWRLVGGLCMAALLPLGLNFMRVLSPYSDPTPLMKYSFVLVYGAVFMLADGAESARRLKRGWEYVPVVWAVLLLLFCVNTDNLLYTAAAQSHRATESYATRMLSRIESCPGYEKGMEIVVIGAPDESQLRTCIPTFFQVDHYSVPLNTVTHLNKHLYYYFNDWLNVPVDEPAEETMIAVSDSKAFQAMPLYPADGSVQVVDGRVVVKVQEHYTPKSDFELAYENRR